MNREALRDIAEITGGKVFEADSAEEVMSVFEDLGEGVGTRTEPREITDGLALAALVAAIAAAAGSLAWFAASPDRRGWSRGRTHDRRFTKPMLYP